MSNRLRHFIRRHLVEFSLLLIVATLALVLWHMNELRMDIHKTTAMETASIYIDAYESLRKVYTSQVVSRVIDKGVQVSHDYRDRVGAIPLPATLSMEWARQIGSNDKGVYARLFSDYPFPWNKDGGAKDSFEEKAIVFLRKNPEKAYFEFETKHGDWKLRYARADRMQTSCISCHNNHPASPKRDWKVGDVRGALEVTIPMNIANFEGIRIMRERILLIIVLAGVAFALVFSLLKWVFKN